VLSILNIPDITVQIELEHVETVERTVLDSVHEVHVTHKKATEEEESVHCHVSV
jgi:hypothetical protein